MKCPQHGKPLQRESSAVGPVMVCPVRGCDVVRRAPRKAPRYRQEKLPLDPGPAHTLLPAGPEKEEQKTLFQMIRMYEGRFPFLSFVYHTPNGEYRHKKTAADLEKMGVRPGVPDIFCPVRREYRGRTYNGLWIELKARGEEASDDQEKWLAFFRTQGFAAVVREEWMPAWRTLCEYLAIRVDADGVPMLGQGVPEEMSAA